MSDQLAVDVVLLPPAREMDRVIDSVAYADESPIRLNRTDCYPHVSLAMGVMHKSRLAEAAEALNALLIRHLPVPVTLSAINSNVIADQEINEYIVERTGPLTDLYLDVMDTFEPLLTHHDVRTEMFASPPEVAPISPHWVSHYYDSRRAEDFRPHITLGVGQVAPLTAPRTFTDASLALCHLGTYCTCRAMLVEAGR